MSSASHSNLILKIWRLAHSFWRPVLDAVFGGLVDNAGVVVSDGEAQQETRLVPWESEEAKHHVAVYVSPCDCEVYQGCYVAREFIARCARATLSHGAATAA